MKVEDLDIIKSKVLKRMNLETDEVNVRIMVHMGSSGIASGAREILNAILDEIKNRKLEKVEVVQVGGMGFCSFEPIVEVLKKGGQREFYTNVTCEKVKEIISSL